MNKKQAVQTIKADAKSVPETIPLKWTKFIPHLPTAKQMAFLLIPHLEAFYGGAASGGKSDALLMAASQYVDMPSFHALILRRTLTDLKMPGALLERSHEWFDRFNKKEARYVAGEHSWYFPTREHTGKESFPARIQFGFIGESNAKLRYQGTEFQFVGFDEVTQFVESDYLYLFSRLRKLICPIHKIDPNTGKPIYKDDCPICVRQRSIPIRMRSASNPGGPGHLWVKRRFKIGPDINAAEEKKLGRKAKYIGKDKSRPFMPAQVKDNPFVDQESYEKALDKLDLVTREQLKRGDWGISPDSRFKKDWTKYYSLRREYISLGEDGGGPVHTRQSWRRIFMTVDSASSSREGPGDDTIYGYEPSWTVHSVWALTADYNLLWLDMRRFRKEIPEATEELIRLYRFWRCQHVCIETNGLGAGIAQTVARQGLIVKELAKHTDKVVNATDAILRMSQGRIWFPQNASWLEEAEEEIFTWMGDPNQTDDVVDTLADAAKDVSWEAYTSGAEGESPETETLTSEDTPETYPHLDSLYQGFGASEFDSLGDMF